MPDMPRISPALRAGYFETYFAFGRFDGLEGAAHVSEPDRIEAKPEFRSLTESEVDAALMEAASPSPITLEIGRLMVAYVHRYDGSRKGLSSSEILNLTPNCCVPIEARALKLASEIVSDPQLAAALQGLIPGMGKDAEAINAI